MSHYRATESDENSKESEQPWPPKFQKFVLSLEDSTNEFAFVDPRRLARVRLIDHENGDDLRNLPPLSVNGPDPVIEPIKPEWLAERLKKRKVPIKSWLLDQTELAGIGNWVGDEILFQAIIYPEHYTNDRTDDSISALHRAIHYVTKTAVETDADSSQFPKDWLMLHRWGKGKKGANVNKLPSGEQIKFVTVGGRTSAYVPALQKPLGSPKKEVNQSNNLEKQEKKLKPEKAELTTKKTTKRKQVVEEEILSINTPNPHQNIKDAAADSDVQIDDQKSKKARSRPISKQTSLSVGVTAVVETLRRSSRRKPAQTGV